MKLFKTYLFANNKGSLIVWLALLLIVLTAIISAGVGYFGARSKSEKITTSLNSINEAVNAVLSYASSNKKLPDNATFPTLIRNTKDPWGNDYIYLYDGNLADISRGGICGWKTTSILDTGSGVYMAFLILSKGPDYNLEATPPGVSTAYVFSGDLISLLRTPLSVNTNNDNLYRAVPLEELKNKAGCYGPTIGKLTILNNALPDGCSGNSYSAMIYPAGGVPFSGGLYNWCISDLDNLSGTGITALPNTACTGLPSSTWSTGSVNLSLTGASSTSGTYRLSIQVQDNNTNTSQKTLSLKVKTCTGGTPPPGPPGAQITPSSSWNLAQTGSPITIASDGAITFTNAGGAQTGACVWYPDNKTLSGKIMRAYFKTRFLTDTSVDSALYGYGLVFALIDATTHYGDSRTCGDDGGNVGFEGITKYSNPIQKGTSGGVPDKYSIGIEFDIYRDNEKQDPTSKFNHIAVVKDGITKHTTAPNLACDPPATNGMGCYVFPSMNYLEDSVIRPVRVEVDATAGVGNPAKIKVWVNCTNYDCNDLTRDYTGSGQHFLTDNYTLPSLMSKVILGFTTSTQGTVTQQDIVSGFGAGFYDNSTGLVGTWKATNGIKDNLGTSQLRRLHTSIAYNGYLYVIGGYDNSSLPMNSVYYAPINSDGTVGTWLSATSLPLSRFTHTSVVNNGYLYVIGGNRWTGVQTVYYVQINTDGSLGTWQTATQSIPVPVYHHTSVVNNGYLYVIGGGSGSTVLNTVYYAQINTDGSLGTWQTATQSIPVSVYLHTSVINNGYLYVIGGSDSSGFPLNTVYYAKINDNGSITNWTGPSVMPVSRYLHTSVVNNGYLYVVGGWSGAARHDTVYYSSINADGSLGGWSTANPINVGGSQLREHHSSVVNNSYLYVIGGQDSTSVRDTVYYTPLCLTGVTCP